MTGKIIVINIKLKLYHDLLVGESWSSRELSGRSWDS